MVPLKDDDLKYYVKQTTNLVFSGQDLQIALTQILPMTRGKRSTGASARIVRNSLRRSYCFIS
ncbi:hypothetical protein SAMN02745150_00551 [Brevinema andersonii]|uniref:Uncharacterized protein n=1 Tax=Brevinema andersonii TaxID=34097 RepID=A0A1I1DPK4_BREAD|nr:hypothetical protein [Brevinema andersonii]SFB74483.1 hypothetical protein SAMN02745150_00551 [Brevinema andersonii]